MLLKHRGNRIVELDSHATDTGVGLHEMLNRLLTRAIQSAEIQYTIPLLVFQIPEYGIHADARVRDEHDLVEWNMNVGGDGGAGDRRRGRS